MAGETSDIAAGKDILYHYFAPAGALVLYGGAAAPTGWLICDGSAVSLTTYSSLYAIIGVTFGDPGGGNFNLPDLRDKFPIGKSGTKALGSTGGSNTKDLEHLHVVDLTTGTPSATLGTYIQVEQSVGSNVHTHDVDGNTNNGGSTTQDVLNAYQALNYIIKT